MLQVLGFCTDAAPIMQIVGKVINIIKIVIPIIIVILAMFDLGKAVIAGEEKEIKEAQKMLVKRLLYGVIIFFVVTIVQIVFNLIGAGFKGETDEDNPDNDSHKCWACATRPNGETCEEAVREAKEGLVTNR